jgi:hypothetical protein
MFYKTNSHFNRSPFTPARSAPERTWSHRRPVVGPGTISDRRGRRRSMKRARQSARPRSTRTTGRIHIHCRDRPSLPRRHYLLAAGIGHLYNTDGSATVPLFVTTNGVNGPVIGANGDRLRIAMDSLASHFAYTVDARNLFPPVPQIALLTINSQASGAGPVIANPSADPTYRSRRLSRSEQSPRNCCCPPALSIKTV